MKSRPRLGRGPQVAIVLLMVGLLGAMAVEPTRQLLLQKQRITSMAGNLAEIEATNAKLRARIERLQDPDYIEQQARATAGLVKPGETSYKVLPPSESTQERRAEKRQTRQAPPPPEPGMIERFLDFVGFI
jgi:cell division protein FtsB